MIIRNIDNFNRMFEIIRSMRKPQIRYRIDFQPHLMKSVLQMEAVNEHGICFYKLNTIHDHGSISKDEMNRIEMMLKSFSSKICRSTFLTYDNLIK